MLPQTRGGNRLRVRVGRESPLNCQWPLQRNFEGAAAAAGNSANAEENSGATPDRDGRTGSDDDYGKLVDHECSATVTVAFSS